MAAGFLKDSLDVAQGAYVQDADPGDVLQKRLWIETVTDVPPIKKRNEAGDGWDRLGYLFNPVKRTIDAAGALTNNDLFIFVDVSAGGFEIDLMDVATRSMPIHIKVLNGGTGNLVQFDPNGAQTIDGEAAMELAEGDHVTLFPQSNTNWETI